VRRKLVETGDVDVMIAIRSNFFYTRTVPCELWHFDKNKPPLPQGEGRGEGGGLNHKTNVLMLDARNIYRKVTRKIYDFSPEQQANLTAIVWLYRGQRERFLWAGAGLLHSAVPPRVPPSPRPSPPLKLTSPPAARLWPSSPPASRTWKP
jgi:type I restriction-modification system DNA methylase subunit